MLTKKYGLHEIHGLWHIPFWQTVFFKIIISIVSITLVMSLILATFFLIKKFRKRKLALPWLRALNYLSITEQKITTQDKFSEMYIEIIVIIKQYLASFFSENLQAMTDTQLLIFLSQKSSDELKKNIEILYKPAYIVKYAHESVDRIQLYEFLQVARAIIYQTMPQKKS